MQGKVSLLVAFTIAEAIHVNKNNLSSMWNRTIDTTGTRAGCGLSEITDEN